MGKRLFIISNRLPINIEVKDKSAGVKLSAGGLVTAVGSYLQKKESQNETEYEEKFWVGVPGCSLDVWSKMTADLPSEGYEYMPVFLNKKTYDGYYNGMSNSVLWALFHYFPSYADYNNANYEHYQNVNREFCRVLAQKARPDDVIWIHDYHLLPLAAMIRQAVPQVTIGFFLHIPFPSYEILRIMPKRWQKDLLSGMLGADLIGFHTADYAEHFLTSLRMTLGIEDNDFTLVWQNRLVKVGVFPISIDYTKFHEAYDHPDVRKQRELLKEQFNNQKLIFSADRLDYTKGVTNRLRAYAEFLKRYPEYHEKVVFVMVIVPSRDGISKYAERKKMIDEFIGSLNSRVGNFRWQPVIYQYNSLDFHDLVAMYTACDLALITPIRDGMNLVAKEFVASRKDARGVLVLSELTGAARELSESLTINPSDMEEIAGKIKKGLEMDEQEQAHRIISMQNKIKKYDVTEWATDFFDQLDLASRTRTDYKGKLISETEQHLIRERYHKAARRLILLDYDGTLSPLVPLPEMAEPDAALLDLLEQLSADPKNTVFIISGRDASTLNGWLGHLKLNFIAEHGAWIKAEKSDWISNPSLSTDWMGKISDFFQDCAGKCPGSFVESKTYSVAWHYRNADIEKEGFRLDDLLHNLHSCADRLNVDIINGNKVVEVRNKGINKGEAVKRLLGQRDYDFILACGDDTTDEDMFRELSSVKAAATVKVGVGGTYAKFNVSDTSTCLSLLKDLLVK